MTSRIGWCDETINPFTGCRNGCKYCYARRMANRLGAIRGTVYERVSMETVLDDCDGDPFSPAIHLDVSERVFSKLERARNPRRVFVGSMGDMCVDRGPVAFGRDGVRLPHAREWSTVDTQAHVARRAEEQPRHTFLLLTKRPDLLSKGVPWPSNAHIGVSVTGNADTGRIDTLLRWGGARVLWASVEPLLDADFDEKRLAGLGWVVVGLQTGPGKAEVKADLLSAAQRIVDWCASAGVPCFVKDNLAPISRNLRFGPASWPREFPNTGT